MPRPTRSPNLVPSKIDNLTSPHPPRARAHQAAYSEGRAAIYPQNAAEAMSALKAKPQAFNRTAAQAAIIQVGPTVGGCCSPLPTRAVLAPLG